MKIRIKLWLCLSVFCWLPAQAGTLSYTDSGTFLSTTPTSTFSAPSKTWAFSFQADTNPAISVFGNGGFDLPFSNFSYTLNGSALAIAPTFIRFFSGGNGGGFEICFTGTTVATCTNGLGTVNFDTQLYTGTTSAPTLSPGSFLLPGFAIIVNGNISSLPDTTLNAATPEPSTLLTLSAGLLVLGVCSLRRRGRFVCGVFGSRSS